MQDSFVYPISQVDEAAAAWKQHDFYASAAVLGIDIGLEGIGIYLRKGPTELWAKTVFMALPESEPLFDRRQKRSWRRCRKNRDMRLRRLQPLLERHGLPWPSDERMGTCGQSDPFILRWRALHQGLGGPEALAICLRHAVTYRGYDYAAAGDGSEGHYPWGDSPHGKQALRWLRTASLDEEMAGYLRGLMATLVWKQPGTLSQDEQAAYEQEYFSLIEARLKYSKEHDIGRVLADHAGSAKHTNLRQRGRGWSFPRKQVEEHIRAILQHPKNRSYVRDPEGLEEALFFKAVTSEEKARTVFHYGRKTRAEMEIHWEQKKKTCPHVKPLGLTLSDAASKCATLEDWAVRRWLILEFLARRHLMVDLPPATGTVPGGPKPLPLRCAHQVTSALFAELLALAQRDHEVRQRAGPVEDLLKRAEVRKMLQADVRTEPGWKAAKLAPGTKATDPNRSYFNQLWEWLCPSRAQWKARAPLCRASAEALYGHATGLLGSEALAAEDFSWQAIHQRLDSLGYEDWRRGPLFEGVNFAQVNKLFGPLPSLQKQYQKNQARALKGLPIEPIACGGLLGRLFRECQAALGDGCGAPDYCVYEVIGRPPRHHHHIRERLRDQMERSAKREAAFAQAVLADTGVASRHRRIELHRQQAGICPFTGMELGEPLGQELEINHLIPQCLGGLSIDENMVLTTRFVVSAKGEQTPYAYAIGCGLHWDELLDRSRSMRWNPLKRDLFAWGASGLADEELEASLPDFNPPPRASQLAQHLKAAVQLWMGVSDDAAESARRMGNPSSWQSAQARRTWLPTPLGGPERAREQGVHHLLAAAVLAYLPPSMGLKAVSCGGIFYSETVPVEVPDASTGRTRTFHRPLTRVLPGLLPEARLAHWRPADADYPVCPVLPLSSSSKWQSIGDATFWKQIDRLKPHLVQRTPLDPTKFATAEEVLAILHRMAPTQGKAREYWLNNLPSAAEVSDWLSRAGAASAAPAADGASGELAALRLRDGTPIKHVWKFDAKGSLKSPLGWSGRQESSGAIGQLRRLAQVFDRLEIWLGYDPKKQRWSYQRRIIPQASALIHLQRFGLVWSRASLPKAPAFLQLPHVPEELWKTLRQILCPPLHPFSVKVGAFRRGDVFKLCLGNGGRIAQGEKPFWSGWFSVVSLNSSGAVEFKFLHSNGASAAPLISLPRSSLTQKPLAPAVLASILGRPSAAARAAELGLLAPSANLHQARPPEA